MLTAPRMHQDHINARSDRALDARRCIFNGQRRPWNKPELRFRSKVERRVRFAVAHVVTRHHRVGELAEPCMRERHGRGGSARARHDDNFFAALFE